MLYYCQSFFALTTEDSYSHFLLCKLTVNSAVNFQPAAGEAELPPYNSSQILQEAFNLRVRLNEDAESDDFRVQTQQPVLVAFVEALQEYMEQTSTSLFVPETGGRAVVNAEYVLSPLICRGLSLII